jgi:NodT family efflux transporter outer membrane factor (OMF) lipoprotein
MLRLGAAIAALAVAGCASVDKDLLDERLPTPPAAWASVENVSGVPSGDWVAAFEDPVLESLIREAMAHNNALLAAQANLEAARASARVVRADLLPSVDAAPRASRSGIVRDPSLAAQTGGNANLSGLRAQDLEDRFGIDTNSDGKLDGLDLDGNGVLDAPIPNRRIYINNYSLGAQLSWEIDLWGRLRNQTKAAYRDARASLADYQGRRLSIAGAVAQSWFQLIQARQQRELSERDVTARERNLKVIERRYESGVATSLDVRLARSALGSSNASLALSRRVEGESARQLEVLLGRYPKAEIDAASSLPDLPALEGAGAPGDLLARRPDLIAAESRMEAAGLRALAARKEFLPRLTLSGNISTSGPELADVIDPERLAGNIAAGLFQPLFRGGQLVNNARRANAQAKASLLNYAQTALDAYREAENALAAEQFLALREEALKVAFEEAAAAEEITERRYVGGAASIFDLLNAQTRRISSEAQYISAKEQRVSNRVQLYMAIGGDFLTTVPPETAAGATP